MEPAARRPYGALYFGMHRAVTGARRRAGVPFPADILRNQPAALLLSVLCVTEIGIGLTGMGLLFTMLGVLLFFDGGLLAVGNVRSSI